MRWSRFARLGEQFRRLRPGRRSEPREPSVECTAEELAEFLEGDLYPNEARPEFREQLREDLWALVQEQYAAKKEPQDR